MAAQWVDLRLNTFELPQFFLYPHCDLQTQPHLHFEAFSSLCGKHCQVICSITWGLILWLWSSGSLPCSLFTWGASDHLPCLWKASWMAALCLVPSDGEADPLKLISPIFFGVSGSSEEAFAKLRALLISSERVLLSQVSQAEQMS